MRTSDALIIRTVDFSETSRIVTAFTQQYGKIEALAKGGLRLKSPFEASLDMLAVNSVTYIPKRSDALDLLTESKLLHRFSISPFNLAGSFAGHYVAELVNAFTQTDDAQPALYDLALNVLKCLEEGTFVMRTLVRFEGNLLHLTGYFPSLRRCVDCNAAVERTAERRIMFALMHSGVLCPHCAAGQSHTVSIRADSLNTLERLIDPRDKDGHWKKTPISRNVSGEIRSLLNRYISHCLGYRPKLYDWFRLIAELDNA
ncbi:MAG: DNA repair protein RecO [Planctomycetaceae bacterium]|jgi:DNA repair protein RecO (recombination protein O)|nr:DNA repair protein RecO [Planctomycetaceae bacterium]